MQSGLVSSYIFFYQNVVCVRIDRNGRCATVLFDGCPRTDAFVPSTVSSLDLLITEAFDFVLGSSWLPSLAWAILCRETCFYATLGNARVKAECRCLGDRNMWGHKEGYKVACDPKRALCNKQQSMERTHTYAWLQGRPKDTTAPPRTSRAKDNSQRPGSHHLWCMSNAGICTVLRPIETRGVVP